MRSNVLQEPSAIRETERSDPPRSRWGSVAIGASLSGAAALILMALYARRTPARRSRPSARWPGRPGGRPGQPITGYRIRGVFASLRGDQAWGEIRRIGFTHAPGGYSNASGSDA
jgi:hypothetical protein